MKTIRIFTLSRRPVGTAEYIKAKTAYKVTYSPDSYHEDAIVPLEEFDAYIARKGLITEYELGQVTLEDLM